jgi:asparagine synthase (glutamine-hydrolysing)
MPGLYGIVTAPQDETTSALAARMAERLRHQSWYAQAEHSDEEAGVVFGRLSQGVFSRQTRPASDGSGRWFAVLEGEIHDAERQRRDLECRGCRISSSEHSEILLHGFIQGGASFLRGVSGSFVAALWNTAERRLVLINDRFGMKPLYFTHAPSRLGFASEVKALLADARTSREINRRGVAQLFMFGQLWNEDTLFESIQTLPSAGLLQYDAVNDRLVLERYRATVEPATQPSSDAAALERIDHAFTEAMKRHVRGAQRLGLSLSGGLDSRTILAGLECENNPVTTVSMGVVGSIDHQCAAEMARIQGCRHHAYLYGAEFLERFLEHLTTMVRLTDGHYISQCVAEPSIPFYRSLGIDVLMRGHAGELMHLDKAYNFSIDRRAWSLRSEGQLETWLMDRLAAFVSGPEQATLFVGRESGEMARFARESLRDSIRASDAFDHPVDRIWHLFLTQRLRRETSLSLVQFGTQVETRLPLLDGELVDALIAAPAALRVGDRIQSHLIARRRPELMKVINANTGARLGAGPLANSLGRLRMKVLRKLGVPGYQPYEKLGLWLRRELRPVVKELLLNERPLSRGMLRADVLKRIVSEHFDQRANHTYLLLVLLVYEVGQRLFFDADSASIDTERLAAVGA